MSLPPHYIVDFAVLTPLPEEWLAMRAHLSDMMQVPAPYPTAKGTIGTYSVVVCYPGDPTNSVSADFTRYVDSKWRPRWIVLLGVAGGFPEMGPQPGDVVVASRIYGLEYGKISDGDYVRRDKFDFPVDPSWLAHVRVVQADSTRDNRHWTRCIKMKRPDRSRNRPKLHIGPVASGDKVIDDPDYQFYADARRNLPDIYAVEMEAAGAATVISRLQSEGRAVSFFMIRGISDTPRVRGENSEVKLGTAQRDSWKGYASAAAAALLEHLLVRPGGPLGADQIISLPTNQEIEQPDLKRAAQDAREVLRRQSDLSATDLVIEARRIAVSIDHPAQEWLAEELKEHAYNQREDILPPYRKINVYASRVTASQLIGTWGNLDDALVRAPKYFYRQESTYPDSISEAERVISAERQSFLHVAPLYDDTNDSERDLPRAAIVYIQMGELRRLIGRLRQRVVEFLVETSVPPAG